MTYLNLAVAVGCGCLLAGEVTLATLVIGIFASFPMFWFACQAIDWIPDAYLKAAIRAYLHFGGRNPLLP